jgi:outer membrane lipoprotein SlyB
MSTSRIKASVCGLLAAISLTIVAVRPVRAEGMFGLSTTATNALGGGAIGAGAGAIIGHQTHHTAAGAAIGGGFGLVSGGLIGHQLQQGEERSAAQQRQINRQQREINRLKQQQAAIHTDDRY